MNITSIVKAAVASASLVAASTVLAAPVMTMTGATATQVLTWSGCPKLTTTDSVTVTFDDSGTFDVVDSGANTVLQGTWFKLAGKTPASAYTVYAAPSVFAPAPDNPDVVASPDPTIPPPAGTLDDFLGQIEATVGGRTDCKLNTKKPPLGSQTVALIQPSTLVKKNTMVVKPDKSGTLTFQALGQQTNMFSGKLKASKFGVTLTIKGTVVEI